MTSWVKNTAVILTLALFFFVNTVSATDCDTLQYLKNKSPGTQILSNHCSQADALALGSQLVLAAGARMWLKSAYDENTDQQLICQNRSAISVRLNITNLSNPWINIENIENCNQWVNNRLSCSIAPGEKFFCVSALVNRPVVTGKPQERTTSISMRAISIDKPIKIASAVHYIDAAVNEMKPEIDLCRHLLNSQAPVELIWNVKVTGQVDDVSILTKGNEELSACIRDVVASYHYPKPKEAVTFVYEF